MLRQIEFAVFDMRLHSDFDPASRQTPLALLQEVRERVAVLHPPGYNRFPNNFSHIFAGGYAAGYYSYKWAEVLSADAYSFFEERRARRFAPARNSRDEILAVGGSRPAAESFRAFRGPRAARRSAAQAQWYDFRMILKPIGVALVPRAGRGRGGGAAAALSLDGRKRAGCTVADTPPPPGAKDVHQWRVTASRAAEGAAPNRMSCDRRARNRR